MKLYISKIKNRFIKIKREFDIFDFNDFLSLIGLIMVFYGFFIWKPMFAYIIVGFIILFISSGKK